MSAAENLPIPLRDSNTEIIRGALSHFEITGVFNTHTTIEDAQKSIEMVEPNSVVYIEGYDTQSSELRSFAHYAQLLTESKRLKGKDSYYDEFKSALLAEAREAQQRPPSPDIHRPRFYLHTIETIRRLIEKDCDVKTADYLHTLASSNSEELASTVSGFISSAFKQEDDASFNTIQPSTGTAQYLAELSKTVKMSKAAHFERERFASIIMSADAVSILSNTNHANNLPRTPSGKIKSYVLYGTAHARSLTHELRSAGASVRPIVVRDIAEHLYLDKGYDALRANMRRRIAFAAFEHIASFADVNIYETTHREVADTIYANMEEFNADGARTAAFCVNCIKVAQHSYTDPDQAYDDLRRILQPYAGTTDIRSMFP